jgi:glycine C-acetyltransferase
MVDHGALCAVGGGLGPASLRALEPVERTNPGFLQRRAAELNARYEAGLARGYDFYEKPIEGMSGAWVLVGGRRMLMLASYSYLGLIGHPQIDRAATEAIETYGTGTPGVRLLSGTTHLHQLLEQAIAQFKQAEGAVVLSSGYVANVVTISTLLSRDSVVIADRLDHASILDGCALSQARFLRFHHNDMASLRRCLERSGGADKLVVVDAVFSMDGDVIDLPSVVQLCRQYDAALMVDEAHSLGVLGATGRGIEEHFGLPPDVVDIKMGTLSKTIPSMGGYVAGSSILVGALKHNARGFVFSAALSPPAAAAALAGLTVMAEEPQRVERLNRAVQRYHRGLRLLGFNTLQSETAIVPIVCSSEATTLEMARRCFDRGLFVAPIFPPAVPASSPRLRTSVTAAHTDEDIDAALEILGDVGRQCGLIPSI